MTKNNVLARKECKDALKAARSGGGGVEFVYGRDPWRPIGKVFGTSKKFETMYVPFHLQLTTALCDPEWKYTDKVVRRQIITMIREERRKAKVYAEL